MPDADVTELGIRREIEAEREQLAQTIGRLRAEADLSAKLRGRLPVVLAGALATGFVLGGGVGATARLVVRRRREGTEKARVGRFALASRR